MQNFAELPVNPSEEIFVVFNFRAREHHTVQRVYVYSNFRGSYFRGGRPIREKRESLHLAKISRYTVLYIVSSIVTYVHCVVDSLMYSVKY